MSEPADGNTGVPVELRVKRKGGLSGVVAVEWKAYITNKYSEDENDEVATRTEDVQDIDISSGVINFVSNQDEMKFIIKVRSSLKFPSVFIFNCISIFYFMVLTCSIIVIFISCQYILLLGGSGSKMLSYRAV